MNSEKININKLALIYGILLGDGCLSKVGTKYHFINISGSIKEETKFFKEVIIPILEDFTGKKIKIKKRVKQRKLEILFMDKELFNYLNNIGFPIGKKGIELMIPQFFNTKSLKYVVQGYFATDGSLAIANNHGIKYPRIEFSSISKRILFQVLKYLTHIGMNGNCYINKIYCNSSYNTKYRL